ncbi:MAG: flavodoxin family protein [Selenomonadaceae bacterium]|nr:flavodoxin family protein [Selenomonadaceae bacterium]
MKVLLINGSPHSNGNTAAALNEMIKIFEAEGVETNLVQVGNKAVRGCVACRKCFETGKCIFNDIVNEVAPLFEEADGLVIGAPVYYSSAAGTAISFMDRLFFSTSTKFDKTMKVGACVVISRRGGSTATFDELNKYFTMTQMPVASSQYWNMAYGREPGEVLQDAEGMQTMRTLARNMTFLMKSIALGKEKFGLPEKENWTPTHFIR